MAFADIFGQERIVRLLQRAARRGTLPHALLFVGVDGVGKKLTAITLAKALNCLERGPEDCCDHCRSCRKAASGNHPDIVALDGEGGVIKIEQVRGLQAQLRFRPLEGKWRVSIISGAHSMRTEAANAILKVLEEPPAGNLLILTAPDPESLLPTITSRCLTLRFNPLEEKIVASYLQRTKGLTREAALLAGRLASGSLARALELVDQEEIDYRRRLLADLGAMAARQWWQALAAAENWRGSKENLAKDLEWIKTWVRDLLVLRRLGDAGELLNPDAAAELNQAAALVENRRLLRLLDGVSRLQALAAANLNRRLSLEALLLELAGDGGDGGALPGHSQVGTAIYG